MGTYRLKHQARLENHHKDHTQIAKSNGTFHYTRSERITFGNVKQPKTRATKCGKEHIVGNSKISAPGEA